MSEIAGESTQLKVKIHSEIRRLAAEHNIALKEDAYQKYVDLLITDEFRDHQDASLEEIAAVLELPIFLASISKNGMQRSETLYASSYSRSKILDTEYAAFKQSFTGRLPALEEISIYLRFFQKKGVLEDYDSWLDENWRLGCSESEDPADFWLANVFMMRHDIRQKLKQSDMLTPAQNKKSSQSKPKSKTAA